MKGKNRLSFIERVLFWINILLCLSLLISYLAPVIDPHKAWLIAFFGLAYPLLLLVNLFFALYWIARLKWQAFASLLCISCGWNMLSNNIGLHKNNAGVVKHDSSFIRVMTYNVHNFKRYGSKNDISTKHDILQIINEQQPDVIGFQEFYTRKHGQYDLRDSILKILGSTYSYFAPVFVTQSEAIGIAIFSKYPITNEGQIPIADKMSENSCIYVDLQKGTKAFRVYTVHLQSIGFDPEDYKYLSKISNQFKPDIGSTRRLGSKLKSAFSKRSTQVAMIKQHAAQCPYPYIISGDFNDTPSSYAVNEMSKGLKNTFREKGFGFGRTYNGDFPNYQIDYILTSPVFKVEDYQIIEKKLSDHYAVRSDLLLN